MENEAGKATSDKMKSESVKTRHAPKSDRDIDVETKAGEVIESFVDDTDEVSYSLSPT